MNEFSIFLLKTIELLKRGYKNKKALGIGVSVAGLYDREKDRIISSFKNELKDIELMKNISKIFKQNNVVIDNAGRLCAKGLIEGISDYGEKTISCISVNDNVEVTTYDKGVCISGKNNLAGRLGDIAYNENGTYADYMRDFKSSEDVFEPVLDLLKIVGFAYDPDIIYLCSDKFTFPPHRTAMFRAALNREVTWQDGKAPELCVVNTGYMETMSGIISRVIGNWLDTMISDE